jgi:hypothetical protein
MRFKPRIIKPENPPLDDDGQLQLPADLQQLGQQLHREAHQLAETYPPATIDLPPPGEADRPRQRRQRRVWQPVLQAAAAVLIVGVIWQQLPDWSALGPQDTPSAKRNQPDLASSGEMTGSSDRQDWATWLSWGERIAQWNRGRTLPTIPQMDQVPFLDEITGPELEGFLDLWELEPTHEAMVAL